MKRIKVEGGGGGGCMRTIQKFSYTMLDISQEHKSNWEVEAARNSVTRAQCLIDHSEIVFHKIPSDISFLRIGKQTKGKIIVDVIKQMSQHSFLELFRGKTKTPFILAIAPTEVLTTMLQYRR